MTNAFMAEFYRDQAQEQTALAERRVEMVAVYDARMLALKATPTTTELNAICGGTPTTLGDDGCVPTSPNIMVPHRSMFIQRKAPRVS